MKAIITAGGKGSRLYPISRAIPKELIPFCGIPVIEYGINLLKRSGIKDIIVVVGIKKSPIIDYFGNGEILGVNIAYIIQEQPKGLGHSIMITEPYIDDDDFILLLGDTIIIGDKDLNEMIKIHRKYNASATILVEHVIEPERYGVIKFDNSDSNNDNDNSDNNSNNNRIISLYEKPKEDKIKEKFKINHKGIDGWYAIAGLYIINKNMFNFIGDTTEDKNNEIQLTDAIKLSLESGNIILGHILDGRRIDVGTWDYIREEKDFYNNMTEYKLEEIIKSRNDKMIR